MGFFPCDTPGFGTSDEVNTVPSEGAGWEMDSTAREHPTVF